MSKSYVRMAVLSTCWLWMACGESPSTITPESVEIVILQGDGQFAPAQQRLPEPLRVVVRRTDTRDPVEDVVVEFSVVEGEGAELDERAVVTDEDGIAATGLRLGGDIRSYRVRASLVDSDALPVEFEAFAVLPPTLTAVPATVTVGEVVELTGTNFSPLAEHNVVLFSGIRGEVVSATPSTLSVRVPECLLSRRATVVVRFGSVSSNTRETSVTGTEQRLQLIVGQDTHLQESDGSACVTLPGGTESRSYLLTLQSAGRVAGARHDIGLRGRVGSVVALLADPASTVSPDDRDGPPSLERDARSEWHAFLRRTEDAMARRSSSVSPPTSPRTGPARAPRVGESREFEVIGPGSEFKTVRATARVVGSHAVLFVDDRAAALISDSDLGRFSAIFDDPIHSVITGAFGSESDLDGNERVIILFTPEVNLLTERGDDGFVAGFFFGLDLLPELAKSNGGEIFYLVVPDPSGIYSDPRTAELLLRVIPPILAHEFQHMVHFNQRVLLGGGGGTDALWLSEGLATMAEDLLSLAPDLTTTIRRQYRNGNVVRASQFLQDSENVSLTVTAGIGSLAERGAGWLFVRYLWEHFGEETLLRALVRSTRTGIDNVEEVTGNSWETLFSDWAIAVQSEFQSWDGLLRERHTFPVLRLGELFQDGPVNDTPPPPRVLGAVEFDERVELWSGGTAQFILTVPANGSISLNFGAADGGPLAPSSRLQLRIVRIP